MVIVITNGSTQIALSVLRSLAKKGLDVIVFDHQKFNFCYFSRFCKKFFKTPHPNEEIYISSLISLLKLIKETYGEVDLIPIEFETNLIYHYEKKLKKYCNILPVNILHLRKFSNKLLTYKLLESYGIGVPDYYEIEKSEDLEQVDFEGKNFVLKILDGLAGYGIKKVDSLDDAKRKFNIITKEYNEKKIILQEYIEGRDINLGMLFEEGKLISNIQYESVLEFPIKDGTSICRCPVTEDINPKLLKLFFDLKLNGIIEIDYLVKDSKKYVIDINYRFFGGINQAIANNVDFPYQYYRIMKGLKNTRKEVTGEKNTGFIFLSILALLQYLIYGNFKEFRKIRYLNNFKSDVFEISDPFAVLGFFSFINNFSYLKKEIISTEK